MIKRKFLSAYCLILCTIISMSFSVSASQNDCTFNWYCVRKTNHIQPIADLNMQWIEEYDGHYIDHFHGDSTSEKVVYLTFDAGYENGNVAKILDVLKQEEVSGAFFILGHLIATNPDLVSRMATDGHLVCNHTNLHKDMTKIEQKDAFQAELESLERLYQEKIGKEMTKFFRPPEGKFDRHSMELAQELGYQTVFWSLAYADWDNNKQPDPQKALSILLENVHNGAVILLHPTSATNATILKDFIQALKADGYSFGTLNELVENNHIARR